MAKKKKGWAGKREKIENIRTEDHTLCIPRPFSASRLYSLVDQLHKIHSVSQKPQSISDMLKSMCT